MTSKRTVIESDKLPKVKAPFSYGVKAGGWVFTAGMVGLDPTGSLVGTTPGRPDITAQTRQTLQGLKTVLEELGVSLESVAKVHGYTPDFRYFDQFNETYAEFFKPPYPALATHGKGLVLRDAIIEVDAIATVSGTPSEVRSPKLADWPWPSAQGGTQVEDVMFTSGHVSRGQNGQLFARGDLRAQTEMALDNLGAALEAGGFDFSDVIMINATVPDWYGFQKYNDIFAKYFREPYEARATIQGNIEMEDMLIQFEAVAARGETKRII
ncbi:MAG: RidA family protein, partial [Desulfatiglandales bacterium]